MKQNSLKRWAALAAAIALLATMTACGADTPGGDESTTTMSSEEEVVTTGSAEVPDDSKESENGTGGSTAEDVPGDETGTDQANGPDSGDNVVDEIVTNKDGFVIDENGDVQLPFIPVPTN